MKQSEFIKYLADNTVNNKIVWKVYDLNDTEVIPSKNKLSIENISRLKFENISLCKRVFWIGKICYEYEQDSNFFILKIFNHMIEKTDYFEDEIKYLDKIINKE